MLILSRLAGEEIVIDGTIRVRVVSTQGQRVRISVDAPRHVTVDRGEVHQRRMGFEQEQPEDMETLRDTRQVR